MRFNSIKYFVILPFAFLAIGSALFLFSDISKPFKKETSAYLINQAWLQSLNGKSNVKPWPWMNTVPVARLVIPGLSFDQFVMKGHHPSVMAHAPIWHQGTDKPGQDGISLILADKNRHFGNLKDLERNQMLRLQMPTGDWKTYKVTRLEIVSEQEIKIPDFKGKSTLVLSTSYPYSNWEEGEKMRFVVVAMEQKQHGYRFAENN